MTDIKTIADQADIIIDGYAFTHSPAGIRVLNLNAPDRAAVFSTSGEPLETCMDDIELHIVQKYLLSGLKYMED